MGKYPPMGLTSSQSEMLDAIFDTFLVPLTSTEEKQLVSKIQGKESIYQVNTNQVSAVSQMSATSLNAQSTVFEFFENTVEPAKRVDLRILDILAARSGSLLLTGYWTPLHQLDRSSREKIL